MLSKLRRHQNRGKALAGKYTPVIDRGFFCLSFEPCTKGNQSQSLDGWYWL